MLPIIVPLFLLSLRHAYELAEAMEARCYLGGRGRTHLIQLRARRMDYAVLAAGFCAIGITLALNYLNVDMLVLKCLRGWVN
jgi:energy-coupling factor transport system permease protein